MEMNQVIIISVTISLMFNLVISMFQSWKERDYFNKELDKKQDYIHKLSEKLDALEKWGNVSASAEKLAKLKYPYNKTKVLYRSGYVHVKDVEHGYAISGSSLSVHEVEDKLQEIEKLMEVCCKKPVKRKTK